MDREDFRVFIRKSLVDFHEFTYRWGGGDGHFGARVHHVVELVRVNIYPGLIRDAIYFNLQRKHGNSE